MHPVALAALTALCWSGGGYFEKQGLKLGDLSPQAGIAVRTATALVPLLLLAAPELPRLAAAGTRPILYLVLGGGLVAGSLGMLCFYAALSCGELGRVMPVAFGLTPLFGFLIGAFALGEPVTPLRVAGILLTCAGVACVTAK